MAKKLRKTFRRLAPLACLLLVVSSSAAARQRRPEDLRPTLILVCTDGLRYDYLEKFSPPNLNRLARAGVRARWMTPAFPSNTFPNFYTIATGLNPQSHGIVENSVYDQRTKALFEMSAREEVRSGRWWLGEPIWVTAEKQGQKTAMLFYPGSEAEIAGHRPTFWRPYDGKLPNEERVRLILSWLDLPAAERPTLLSVYFSDVDDAGHDFGPDAPETGDAVRRVDAAAGQLVAGLEARGILERVNLVFLSDHGMATVDRNNAVILDEMFDTAAAEKIVWSSEIVGIFPRAGREREIYVALREKLPPQARVYRKTEIPARFHYSRGPRIAPLLVLPEEGWIVTSRKKFEEMREKGELKGLKGGHGYDNRLPSMRATFFAHGPAFRRAAVVEPFDNVHVYNIMARALGLRPAPNEGNFDAARAVLNDTRTPARRTRASRR